MNFQDKNSNVKAILQLRQDPLNDASLASQGYAYILL